MNPIPISGICMGVMSADEIRSLSEGELTSMMENRRNVDVDMNGVERPIDLVQHPRQGVFPDMGGDPCEVCGSKKFCPGHPMHIELEYPVINPIMAKEVLYTLNAICPHCKRSMYPVEKTETLNINAKGTKRIKAIQKRLKKDDNCYWPDCQLPLPKYEWRGDGVYYWYDITEDDVDADGEKIKTKNGNTKKIVTKGKKDAIKKPVTEIIELFKSISQEEFDNLGFNNKLPTNKIYSDPDIQIRPGQTHRLSFRPEDMIMTAFPIASKIITVATSQDDDDQDNILARYRNILKQNMKLYKHRTGANLIEREKDLNDIRARLTQDISTIIDNTGKKTSQSHNNRELRTFAHIIKGKRNKFAIFRNNINGKRLEANARTVISPGPFLRSYEVGVPQKIADVLTMEEIIWPSNIDHFQGMIDDALANDERIPFVIRRQKRICLKYATKNYTEPYYLKVGDIVLRKMHTGDIGKFGRQPSLRTESMQGIKARVINGNNKNFRLPLCVVTPYNADYDGPLQC